MLLPKFVTVSGARALHLQTSPWYQSQLRDPCKVVQWIAISYNTRSHSTVDRGHAQGESNRFCSNPTVASRSAGREYGQGATKRMQGRREHGSRLCEVTHRL